MRTGFVLSIVILFMLPGLIPALQAQGGVGLDILQTRPVTLGERVEMHSEILDTKVSMNIYLPEGFATSSSAHTYPVIFSNGAHGEEFFEVLGGLVKHLGSRERMPESIVVSLNDMGDIPEIFSHGMWGREKLGGSGDPSASLRHLQEEVIPFLEKNYRANDYRVIIGVSGSTLFPIHIFNEAPGLFDSFILIAAADTIGMGYDAESTFIDSFAETMATKPGLKTKLYVGTADRDVEKNPEYQANLEALEARLGENDRLDLKIDVVENADHYAVFIKAILSAFDQNFPFERWTSRYRDLVAQPGDALENIDRYYAALSKDYGFTILPRADRWNNVNCLRFMVRHLIREERPEEALSVAKRRLEYQPHVAASFADLANAYEANGLPAEAIKAQEKAVRLARIEGAWRLEGYLERLEDLKAGEK